MTNATAEKNETTFRMSCAVRCDVNASPEVLWSLLTDAEGFPSWNSTVTSIEGPIRLGQKLAIKVPLDPKRTFTPKVTKLEENREMVWADGFAPMFRGVRTYTLTPKGDGVTEFAMEEVFSGMMLPMIKGSLPDFGPVFETYARDLKRAAEGGG
ncbi:MAG: SRPBCC family protein [Sandaracinaceae bacterium]